MIKNTFLLMSFLMLMAMDAHADEVSAAPKIGFRLNNGLLTNSGTSSGSSTTFGGLNPYVFVPVNPVIGFGAAYNIDFDFSGGSVPLKGFDVFARYYYWNTASKITETFGDSKSVRLDRYSAYALFEVGTRSYFVGNEAGLPVAEQSGDSSIIDIGTGIDYRISSSFELNAELNIGLISFAGSDSRVKISGNLLKIGVGYLF